MTFEHIESIYCLLINVAALMICLFQYISKPRKTWTYSIVFFLTNLLSNYYWCVYMLVMGDYPNVSSFFAYFGWNVAFVVLPMMLYRIRYEEEKGFFSPLCLLPVPLNILQFFIYIQYGGIFNNVWQGVLSTVAICISLNSIIYYLKNKKSGAKVPYMAIVGVVYVVFEYIMWTSSCYDWPSEWLYPYNYASVVEALTYIFFPLALIKTYEVLGKKGHIVSEHLQKIFRPLFIGVIVVCGVGGYFLAIWMRNTLVNGINKTGDADPFKVIAVMLFVVSVIIVFFSLIIILVISLEYRAFESRELKEAKIIAERSNAAKSDFLANMSHEIRTPLNAVLGMNEMILEESLKGRDFLPEDEQKIREIFADICNYSGNINSAGNNLLSIINDILDLSKIEAGKMEIVDADYKLSSVINDVSNMVAFKAKSKELEFDVDVDATIPDGLNGDEVRIRQIITNILNNSVKYTKTGTVSLNVRAKRHAAGEDGRDLDIIINIKDTGIGIKQEDIEKLFKKFERVDLQKNSTIEGTGLGLTITKSLLDMMGGTINVESTYGQGSLFTIVIPQKIISFEPIGDFRAKFEKTISEKKARRESFRAPDAHILVVDDTRMNLTVAKGLLRNTGINIDTADSGRESIELATKNVYDIIFMDQRMPEMDGVTAMHAIKDAKDNPNSKVPFICLTADAVSGARERYIAEGFDDYLTKPIDSKELEKMIIKYLPKEKLSEELFDSDLIDKVLGLHFCKDDEDFYKAVLEEYNKESDNLLPALEKYYSEQDWDNYGVSAHALKSTSKIIGATKLSEIAAGMEAAAGNNDVDLINKEHGNMIKAYKEVLGAIRK